MKDGGFAVTGVLLLMLFSASVMARSNVEHGGKLYQFRDTESAAGPDDASESEHKFRPIQHRSGGYGPAGRSIGGAADNDQGYMFRPLRNRRRSAPGSDQVPRENLQVCPAIDEKPKQQSFSTPAYSRHQSRQRRQRDYGTPPPPGSDGYGAPLPTPGGYGPPLIAPGEYGAPLPPPGGYLTPMPDVTDYPHW